MAQRDGNSFIVDRREVQLVCFLPAQFILNEAVVDRTNAEKMSNESNMAAGEALNGKSVNYIESNGLQMFLARMFVCSTEACGSMAASL